MKDRVIVRSMFKDILGIKITTMVISVLSLTIDGAVTGSMLEAECMTAYGLMLPVATIIAAFSGAFSNGIATITGKNLGAGNIKKMNRDLSGCLEYALIFSLLLTLAVVLQAGSIAAAFNAEGKVLQEAVDYLWGYSVGIPASFLAVSVFSVLQILGKKRELVLAMAAMTLVNCCLDVLNGAVLHLGLFGMGLATSLGYAAALLIAVTGLRKNNSGMLQLALVKPSFAYIAQLFRYGVPGTTAMIFRNVLAIIVNHQLLQVAGFPGVSAFAAIMSVMNLAMSFGTGLGVTVSMLTGLFWGEQDAKNIREVLRLGISYSLVLNTVISLVFWLFARQLMGCFVQSNPEILELAASGLRLMGLFLVFYSLNAVLRFYYQAAGVIVIAYSYAFMNCLVCTAIPLLLLTKLLGVNGVWLAYPLGELLTIPAMLLIVCLLSQQGGGLRERIMCIPKDFYDSSINYAAKINTLEQVVAVSEYVRQFIISNDGDEKKAYYIALAIEEFCTNSIQYGFEEGKSNNIELLVKKDVQSNLWIVRIRDDCQLFNITKYLELTAESESYEHVGIKIISGLAKEVQYLDTMKYNCITVCV